MIKFKEVQNIDGLYYVCGKIANGYYTYGSGEHRWFKNGLPHRTDGPAIIHKNGEIWLVNGLMHRVGAPAFIQNSNYKDQNRSYKEWLQNGIYYRENDLHHLEYSNGDKAWVHNLKIYNDFNEYLLVKIMT